MRIISTICARSGSKGVPRKNLREIAGKPLIAHTVEQAISSGLFVAVAVSSDDKEILAVAEQYGATHLVERPAELASDVAPKIPAIRHCVQAAEVLLGEVDVVVDLDATSPLRNIGDIHGCLAMLNDASCSNVITGCVSRRSPYFNLVEIDGTGRVTLAKSTSTKIFRRQDAPKTFDLNASIYVWRRNALMLNSEVIGPQTRLFVMPEERSLDIDSEFDFKLMSYLMSDVTP